MRAPTRKSMIRSRIVSFGILALLAAGGTFAGGPALAPLRDPLPFLVNLPGTETQLPFRVKDAAWSAALNAIIAVAESPNQLHIYHPDTNTYESVNLQVTPACVSVSPDGLYAAVGHNGWVSYVRLSDATLLKTIPVSANVIAIVLGGNGYAYAFSNGYYVHSIELTSETDATFYEWRQAAVARLHPSLTRIYGADRNVSPEDIIRYDIPAGPVTSSNDSVYHGDYAMCGNVWISEDGLRLFTACGNVFRASADPNYDMRYAGKLSEEAIITWVSHAQAANLVAALPGYSQYTYPPAPRVDNEIHYYTHDYLLYRGKAVLPPFVVGGVSWAPRGRWIFFGPSGIKQYVITQADEASGILYDYGIVTIDCTGATVSLNPQSATISGAATTMQFAVTGSAGCGWKAQSDVAWIDTVSTGVGDGSVTLTIAANPALDPRTGTVTVGDAVFSITQNPKGPPATATATSTGSITVTWPLSFSADHYEIWRTSGGAFQLVTSDTTGAYADSTVSPDTAYVYKIRMILTGGDPTDFGSPDYAHTFTFDDEPLTAGTFIKAVHVTQLRTVINAIRAAAGLPAASFTDPALPGVVMKLIHVTQLRDALNDLRASMALPPISFATPAVQSPVSAQPTEALRAATQ